MQIKAIAIAAAGVLTSATVAAASSHHEKRHDGMRDGRVPTDPAAASAYHNACGACHTPYAPDLLGAESWRMLFDNLEDHFGQRVEIDANARQTVERWLAGPPLPRPESSHQVNAEALPRITKSAWFQRKHRKIGPNVVQRPSVGTMSNCVACHRTAAKWDFDEHRVMIPAQ